MKKPLYTFIEQLQKNKTKRFFMPGHKGELGGVFETVAPFDITEIKGADYLYGAEGVIGEVEAYGAEVFGSGASIISVGGSSQSIAAMCKTAFCEGDEFLCERNCHVSAVHAIALLGLCPTWLYPETHKVTNLAQPINSCQVEIALRENPGAKGVFLTSPNYFGQVADIGAIAKVCEKYGVKLLVDNAHGAILKFLKEDNHPIALGADFCCDSLHKTLPALTGTGLLHMRDSGQKNTCREAMALFGSTSPSYVLMLSVEDCLHFLKERDVEKQASQMQGEVAAINKLAREKGFCVIEDNFSLRLCLSGTPLGYKGEVFGDILREEGVEPEYTSEDFVVLLPGLGTKKEEYRAVAKAVAHLPKKDPLPFGKTAALSRERAMGVREAVLAVSEEILVEDAVGRVCAQCVSPCPPGIPLVMPGEVVDSGAAQALKNSGFLCIKVVQ